MKTPFFIILFFFSSLKSFSQTVNELSDSLEYYYNSNELEKAITISKKLIIAVKKNFGESDPDYIKSLNNLARLYERVKQFEKAEPLYVQAKEIRKKTIGENDLNYASSLINLGALYVKMGQYEKAEPLYVQAREIRKLKLSENHPDNASLLNNLAALYMRMGQYEKAEPLYVQAKEIRKTLLGENHPDFASILNNLAGLYQNMGQYETAVLLCIQAKEIRKNILGENHPDYATSLNNLAGLYQNMGQYETAEPLYTEAMAIRKKTLGDTHPDYISSLNNIASLYHDLGQYEKSENLYLQAKDNATAVLGANHMILNNLASLYQDMGQHARACELLIESVIIRRKILGEWHPDYARSLNNLALFYTNIEDYEKAEPLYMEAEKIWKKALGVNHPDYITNLNNLAGLYQGLGEYKTAEALFIESKESRRKLLGENHLSYAESLNNLAILYQDLGQYKSAAPFLIKNSQIVLQNLVNSFNILSEKEKNNFIAHNISLINTNNSFLYNSPNSSHSILQNNFNQQLIFKSLTLADTRNILELVKKTNDTTVQKLLKDWKAHKIILSKQYSLPVSDRRTDLKRIENTTENLEKELNRKSAEFRNQQKAIRISLQDVQRNLQHDEVAIEFVSFRLYKKKWTDSVLYAAYILTKNDSVPIFVPLCEERQLQQLFDSAGKTATNIVSSFYRGIELLGKNKSYLGKDLYKLIWEPLETYLKGIKKVSYSPAGKLYGIAFHSLSIDSTTMLMDKYQLQQYTSTRQVVLRNAEKQTVKPGSITLFGNASFTMDSLELLKQKSGQPQKENISTSIYKPQRRSSDNNTWTNLPGTAEEVSKIKLLFEQNKITTKSFTQTSASEEKLKAMSGNSPQILHIATHGFFLPEPDKKKKETGFDQGNTYTLADDPLLRSGLILAGGNYAWSGKTPIEGVEDGIATAYEISQLNLSNTELVVLSACETALGDVKGSEGVFGLQRAFKMAGVKKMIVSLWQVPDKETAELMTLFYANWMKGSTINAAFSHAQAEMRKKYSPFYWAAFVLVE